MKPEEAEKKWCPMTFANRASDKCIADHCMAWVWDILPSTNGKGIKHPGRGHCGLIGGKLNA